MGGFGGWIDQVELGLEVATWNEGFVIAVFVGVEKDSSVHFEDVSWESIDNFLMKVLQFRDSIAPVPKLAPYLLRKGPNDHGFLFMIELDKFSVLLLVLLMHYSK